MRNGGVALACRQCTTGSGAATRHWRHASATRIRGFTLIEIVLAIGLSASVLYLLTTAIELFIVRSDAGRQRVESAQVARALLDQIAADLASARYGAPSPQSFGGNQQGGGGQQGSSGGAGQQSSGGAQQQNSSGGGQQQGAGGTTGGVAGAGGGSQTAAAAGFGLVGTATELRLDRAAYAPWERSTREVAVQTATAPAELPVTVRYFLSEGDRQSAADAAARGITDEDIQPGAGLCRETVPTAATVLAGRAGASSLSSASSSGVSPLGDGAKAELIAPEAVRMTLAYYNGTEFVDSWDTRTAGGMPMGVEIRLELAEPRENVAGVSAVDERRRLADGRLRENEIVEYRRFVLLPRVTPPRPAQPLFNPSGGGGYGGGQPGGQNGQGPNQNGGGNGGGGQGGGNPQGGGNAGGRN